MTDNQSSPRTKNENAPFTRLKNKFGAIGAWVAIVILIQLILIVPLVIVGMFFLALKFVAWSALSLFSVFL